MKYALLLLQLPPKPPEVAEWSEHKNTAQMAGRTSTILKPWNPPGINLRISVTGKTR